jgi:FkbM family methyltransferase
MSKLKRAAALLPERWQTELKRIHFKRQISKDNFVTDEPEYQILHNFITHGDWVIDIGANVGHYTKRFSDLAGPHGRVIAFEPVPTTFSLLSANVQLFTYSNVSLINTAISDKTDLVGIFLPKFSTGLTNYYEAQISSALDNSLSVLAISLDTLCIDKRVALIKVDVEGHELKVLKGMLKFLEKHRPVLIIETNLKEVISTLKSFDYIPEKMPNSPNILFKPNSKKLT